MTMFGAPRKSLDPLSMLAMQQPFGGQQQFVPGADPAQAGPAKPSFGAPGGLGEKLGMAGSILLNNYAGGAGQPYMQMIQQQRAQAAAERQYQTRRADTQADWLAQQQWELEHPAPKYFQNEAGDYVKLDPSTDKASVVYDGPNKVQAPTALEQQVSLLRRLDPKLTDTDAADIVKRGIIGGQYDPSIYRPMVDYKAQAARQTKAMPTYAQSHPKASGGPGKAPKLPTGFILD